MWNTPNTEKLSKIPKLYETERIPLKEKIIHLHFFLGACDWFIAEYDPTEDLFFGYANLGDDLMAEWGYISFRELRELRVQGIEVDCDLYWELKPAKKIEKIIWNRA